jgi:hypothetical protein
VAAIAHWLAASQARRIVFMATLFPFPFMGPVSSAIVAMTAQTGGVNRALTECVYALALLAGMAWIVGLELPLVLGSAGLSWGIVLLMGAIVGQTRSFTLAVQAAVMLALGALLVLPVVLGDPVSFWTPILERIYADLAADGFSIEVDIEAQAGITGAALITGAFVGVLLSMLLGARWANVVAPQFEVQSFAELRLGYAIGGLAALAGLAGLVNLPTGGAVLLLGTAFMFQGLAVLIWWSRMLAWSGGWWLGLSLAMLILPSILVLVTMSLATVGFIDNWYGLRRTSVKL